MAKTIATQCPICSGALAISRLTCAQCDTRIETELPFSALMRLPDDLRDFVLIFLRCRGNIREVEKELGVSYPTVCKRLDAVNDALAGKSRAAGDKRSTAHAILARLESGEITAKEAALLLKEKR